MNKKQEPRIKNQGHTIYAIVIPVLFIVHVLVVVVAMQVGGR